MAFALSGFGILHALTISSAGGAENPSPYVTLKIEADAQSIDAVAAAVGAGAGDMHALKHMHDLTDPLMPPTLAGITSIDTWYEARARHTLTAAAGGPHSSTALETAISSATTLPASFK